MTILIRPKNIFIASLVLFFCCILNCCNSSSHNYYLYKNKNHPHIAVKEYINRVGKRILITSYEKYIVRNFQISFDIDNKQTPLLKIEQPKIFNNIFSNSLNNNSNNKKYTIVISTGLLQHLHDEAMLATVLAVGIEIIHSNNFFNPRLGKALRADARIINSVYNAGYDPEAFIDLQKEYLILKRQNFTNNWLDFLFYNVSLSPARIAANKKKLLSLPKGLEKGKQSYLENTKSFRTFNW